MSAVVTVLTVAAVVFLAWLIPTAVSWALVNGAARMNRQTRTHYRDAGPVRIDPDKRETIHVRNRPEGAAR